MVTTETGCAKGVLHRQFDAFLAELVEDRIGRISSQATALRARLRQAQAGRRPGPERSYGHDRLVSHR